MGNWWDGAAKLLSAGPLGLGAIVVIITGSILITGKAIEQGRLKLSLSMLAAGCILVLAGLGVLILQNSTARAEADAAFAKATASTEHIVYFHIEPLDLSPTLPAPTILVNNKALGSELSYTVNSDVTVIVNVQKALDAMSALSKGASPDQLDALKKNQEQLVQALDTSIAQVQRIAALMNQSCSGGPHGVNPLHYEDVVSLSNNISTSLTSVKAAISASK